MHTRNTKSYQQSDARHYMHPFTDGRLLGETARIIERADNIYLWDTEGNQFLDGMSGLWCVNIGYGRHEMAEAVARQMKEIPYYNNFFQCVTPRTVELAEKLASLAPDGFNHVFFVGSGSEANDTVIRMIRRYWDLQGESNRNVIISRHNAYHGSTVGSASLGGMAFMHEQGGLPIPDIVHIRQPYYFGEGQGYSESEFGLICAKALEEKIEEIGPKRIAAFIGEPIQGAGGVIIPPSNYWGEIQKICDYYDIPIVADEVICGFGRLGCWFGSERFGIRAKLMPIAKGLTSGYLPMGGVMVHDDIANVIIDKCGEFAHGFTYSGHPTCAAVALENIRIMTDENIVGRVSKEIAPYFKLKWQSLESHALVAQARSFGMVGALELSKSDGAPHKQPLSSCGALCRDLSLRNGLIMRAVRDTMIVSPPLIITTEQIDELVLKVAKTLDDLGQKIA